MQNNQISYSNRLIRKYNSDQYPEYTGKYVRQIINTAGKMDGKTIMFSVDDCLCVPDMDGKGKNNPLGSTSLNRYELILNDGTAAVRANLPADEVHALAERCRAVVHGKIIKKILGLSQPEQQQAAPVKIMMGKFKGKTPEEVLLENPNNAQELMNTANYIYQNMNRPGNERYRDGNARQIQAIKAAIDSLNKGTLKPAAASSVKVYDGKWKNHSKKLENGLCRAYRLEINCHMSGPSPWELIIEEGDVPVDIEANNKQIIRLKELQNRTAKRIYMGEVWENIIEKMDANLKAFEASVYEEQKAYMEANSYYFLQKKRGQGAGQQQGYRQPPVQPYNPGYNLPPEATTGVSYRQGATQAYSAYS